MSDSKHRETATVYPFPEGGRSGRRRLSTSATQVEGRAPTRPQVIAATACGCWYHEEALNNPESEPSR